MNIKNYVRAQSLEEAYQLNQKRRNCILGGMLWLNMSDRSIDTAVDLCDLGLNTIEVTEDAFFIGSMASLRQLEQHRELNDYTCSAIAKSVRDIVGIQFRNMATAGGSIFGRFGFSDVLTMFLALDCQVELYRGGIVPLEEFAGMKKDRDVMVRLIVKKTPGIFAYQSVRNAKTDFPVLTCGVGCVNGEYRISIGARPAKAMLLRDEEGLLSGGVTVDSAAALGRWVAERVPTSANLRGSAAYRTRLVQVLTQRAVLELGGMNHGN